MNNFNENHLNWLFKIYRQAIKNLPFLKFSWVLIVAILVLTLIAFFKLNNTDVFIYAVGVILLCFLCFLFSSLTKSSDKFLKGLFKFISTCIILTFAIAVLGFGSFIIFEKPIFYKRWFPNIDIVIEKETDTLIKRDTLPSTNPSIDNTEKIKNYPDPILPKKTLEDNLPIKATKEIRASQEIKIAILPFEFVSNDKQYNWLSTGIPESIIGYISKKEKYLVIEAIQRDKVLKEIDFQQGRYVDVQTAVTIGKLLGSQQIMIGSCQIFGEQIKIIARIVNVETGIVDKKSITEYVGKLNDAFEIQKNFATSVCNNLN